MLGRPSTSVMTSTIRRGAVCSQRPHHSDPLTKRNFRLTDARVGSAAKPIYHMYCARKRLDVTGNLVDGYREFSTDRLHSSRAPCSQLRQSACTRTLAAQINSGLRARLWNIRAVGPLCVGVSHLLGAVWIVICLGLGLEYGSVRPKPGCAGPAGRSDRCPRVS
jgi:hypothetical protein